MIPVMGTAVGQPKCALGDNDERTCSDGDHHAGHDDVPGTPWNLSCCAPVTEAKHS
jgi:hypothetical protein